MPGRLLEVRRSASASFTAFEAIALMGSVGETEAVMGAREGKIEFRCRRAGPRQFAQIAPWSLGMLKGNDTWLPYLVEKSTIFGRAGLLMGKGP
jgi:hypothetical protein